MGILSIDIEVVDSCPWCEGTDYYFWGNEVRGFQAVKCRDCGLIYIYNRLNPDGLAKYYENYLSQVHQSETEANEHRKKMYRLEYGLIKPYIIKSGRVLDVGCSGGYFLDYFHKEGFSCYGVEFGSEAAAEASKKYHVWQGDFPKITITSKFDLVIFRGVIEHIPNPKAYLDKALSLLNQNGIVFITSTPDASAFCCELFKEMWNQHEPEAHLMHFTPRHFDEFFKKKGMEKLLEEHLYEETPYADIESDITKVSYAIKIKRKGGKISFRSPAFWSNMLSLAYKKYQRLLFQKEKADHNAPEIKEKNAMPHLGASSEWKK